jgi:hypothetical protein
LISQALSFATEMSMDAALFGSNAATTAAPQGLLHGLTPLAASAVADVISISLDLGNIAEAIANAGFNVDDMLIVTSPKSAMSLRVSVGPKFNYTVLSSAAVPVGTVIGLAPNALFVGTRDAATIEVNRSAAFHFEDTNPQPIVVAGTPPVVAAPTRSLFQQDMIGIKLRAKCAWTALAGSVAFVSGANW